MRDGRNNPQQTHRGGDLGLRAHFLVASPTCLMLCIGVEPVSAVIRSPWPAEGQHGPALVFPWQPWCEPQELGLSVPWWGSWCGRFVCASQFSLSVSRTQQRSRLLGRVLLWADIWTVRLGFLFFHPFPKFCPASSCRGQMCL